MMIKLTSHIELDTENECLVWKKEGPFDGLSFLINIHLDPFEFVVNVINSEHTDDMLQSWLDSANSEIKQINQLMIERLQDGRRL